MEEKILKGKELDEALSRLEVLEKEIEDNAKFVTEVEKNLISFMLENKIKELSLEDGSTIVLGE